MKQSRPASAAQQPGQAAAPPSPGPGSAFEVLLAFLRLGLTSFGGPVAHLGYFRADEDSKPGAPVFNRTVTLKDSWAKDAAKA